MSREADMSVCDEEVTQEQLSGIDITPPNYVFGRVRSSRSITMDDFNAFKDEIKTMIHSLCSAQQQELKNISPTLRKIEQTNANIENSIAQLTSQGMELTNKMIELENKSKEYRDYITLLEEKIENLEMGWRKSNFEIKNVPKKLNESKDDLVGMIISLSETIGANLSKCNIKDIYRLRGKKDSQNTSIIVETSSTMVKTNIIKLCKAFNIKTKSKLCAKHLGFRTYEDMPIYVSEQLTMRGSRLHFLARDLAKSKQYKYCWTAYGKVYVRKTDNSAIILIKSEAQVQHLMNTD
ncbi:unnamed protein product [Diatraea saccharalis]|uniref:FP protein C-terminal domain-containing protein n=1 Tax=Diatraea saccharalis TaxID=40085 RepID=A0A9N9WG46_9NEOP|nr:unnamed protein product [Diatraea saccharalis]